MALPGCTTSTPLRIFAPIWLESFSPLQSRKRWLVKSRQVSSQERKKARDVVRRLDYPVYNDALLLLTARVGEKAMHTVIKVGTLFHKVLPVVNSTSLARNDSTLLPLPCSLACKPAIVDMTLPTLLPFEAHLPLEGNRETAEVRSDVSARSSGSECSAHDLAQGVGANVTCLMSFLD